MLLKFYKRVAMFNKIKASLFFGKPNAIFNGIITLAKGALLARALSIACIPILTRLYSPEDYGVLALYVSLVVILAPILSLRYVQAIPLPKTDALALNIISLSLRLILVTSLFLACVFFLWNNEILTFFNMEVLIPWWYLVVIGAIGTAFYELLSLWATRKKQYKVLAASQISQSIGGNLTKIVLGFLFGSPAGLIVGQLVSQSGGVGYFIKSSFKELYSLSERKNNSKHRFVSRYYSDFPRFRLPSQFLMVISLQSPILMMASLYGKEVTGQLSLAIMSLSLPVGLVGSAVAKAYYAEIASLGRNNVKKIKNLTILVQKKLFLVGFPLALFIYFFSDSIFVIAFGDEWAAAGVYASALAPFILFQFTSGPLMEVFNVIEKQKYYLNIHFLRLVGLIALFFFSKQFSLSDSDFILFLSGYLSLFYMLVSYFVIYVLKKSS